MFTEEEVPPIQNMPCEIIIEILSYCGRKEKRRARVVCQRWRWILDHPESCLVRFNASIINERSAVTLLNSQLYLENVSISGVKMIWPWSVTMNFIETVPVIRNLVMQIGNSEDIVMRVLEHLVDQSKSLKLDRTSLANVQIDSLSRFFKDMEWNNLSELIIAATIPNRQIQDGSFMLSTDRSFHKWEDNHLEGLETLFLSANILNLKKLQLDLTSVQKNEISLRIINFISKFTTFLERHAKTLKGLSLFISFRQKIIDKYPCSRCSVFSTEHQEAYARNEKFFKKTHCLKCTMFSTERQEAIARILKLESLDIRLSHSEAMYYLVPPCLWKCDRLTSFTWIPLRFIGLVGTPSYIPHPGHSLIQMSRNTITHLTLTLNFWFLEDINLKIDLTSLQYCAKLKRLSLSVCKMDLILSVEVRLPTVTHFKLSLNPMFRSWIIQSNPRSAETSAWIARTFVNVESIEMSFPKFLFGETWSSEWLMNLLTLKKLKEIRLIPRHDLEYEHILRLEDFIFNSCEEVNRPKLSFSFPKRTALHRLDFGDYTSPRIISVLPADK